MSYLPYLCVMCAICSAIGLVVSLLLPRASRFTEQRVLRAAGPQGGVPAPDSTRERLPRFLSIGPWLGDRLGMTKNVRLQGLLFMAGFRTPGQKSAWFTARLAGPVLGLCVGALAPSHRLLWIVLLAGLAYSLPAATLSWRARGRRNAIRQSIPEAVDLLVICVEAGLSVDQSVLRVGQELGLSHPAITSEFLHVNLEQRAGKARLVAWRDMSLRVMLPEIDAFVNMLAQAERFGTPISRALSSFSDDIRIKRRQKAEELAAKTTVKIIFPLVVFIFPSMFIVLVGPAAINIFRGLVNVPH